MERYQGGVVSIRVKSQDFITSSRLNRAYNLGVIMTRTVLFVLLAALLLSGGCAITKIEDGKGGSVTSVRILPTPVYVAPGYYGTSDYRFYRGDTRGIACTGPFGQTINGICYHTKPAWMR